MRLRTPLDRWSASLLATLGVLPTLATGACGGRSVDLGPSSSGSASGSSSGGAASGHSGQSGVPEGGSSGSVSMSGASGGSSTGSTMPPNRYPCNNPKPYVPGADTGFELCDTGFVHRPIVHTCPTNGVPTGARCNVHPGPFVDASIGGCTSDSECTALPNGACLNYSPSGGFPTGACECFYGCTSDADCGSGKVCLCGSGFNQCIPASCASDADCATGELCTMSTPPGTCPSGAPFACQSQADTCGGNTDCSVPGSFQVCDYSNSRHECVPSCVFGRPFLVRGTARTAETARRADWQEEILDASVHGLGPETREALGQEWARMAAMEHASIAAFARFALQLLSVGAPASLVEQTHRAMRDETRHAKMCFALASRYAGRPVGPGKLSVGDALSDVRPEAILVTTILEGCIGETVAAIEAAEALAYARDSVVRDVLATIAEDEKRHAELAWQYVRWATSQDDGLRALAVTVFAKAVAEARAETEPACDSDTGLLPFGVVSESLRREIRARVLLDAVSPCARALLAGAPTPGPLPLSSGEDIAFLDRFAV